MEEVQRKAKAWKLLHPLKQNKTDQHKTKKHRTRHKTYRRHGKENGRNNECLNGTKIKTFIHSNITANYQKNK